MSYLRFDNVWKTYPSNSRKRNQSVVPALRALSFSLERHEIFMVVGPSGSGKTTTLRLIAGLETADRGEIVLQGTVLNSVPPEKREVAMVFQTPALFPHLTVAENIGLGLRLRKHDPEDARARVRDAASVLGLVEKLHCYPRELSGGEAQRVSLGRALVRGPKLFLLDEPLSNLDPVTRKQLRREILCLREKLGVPMIYVTHDPREALAIGDRVAVLRNGELQQVGTAEELRTMPANSFVSEFLSDEF